MHTTKGQFYVLLNFMEKNPKLVRFNPKVNPQDNYIERKKLWLHLTERLNAVGPPIKTMEKWKKVWKDLKTATKKRIKSRNLNNDENNTDNETEDEPSEMDQWVIKILRLDLKNNVTKVFDSTIETIETIEVDDEMDPLTSESEFQNSEIVNNQSESPNSGLLSTPKNQITKREQFAMILDFIETHPLLLQINYKLRAENTHLWTMLTDRLNEIGPPIRTIDRWKKVWADMRMSIRRRIEEKIKKFGKLKNNPNFNIKNHFTEVERRIYKILQMNVSKNNSSELMDSSSVEFEILEVDDETDPLTSESECNNTNIVKTQFQLVKKPPKKTSVPLNQLTQKDQFDMMLDFMKQNPMIAQYTSHNRPENTKSWTILTEQLNAIGPPIRTIDRWRKVWADLKMSIKKRIREKIDNFEKMNINPNNTVMNQLTDVERRMYVILQLNLSQNLNAELIDTCSTSSSSFEFEIFEVQDETDPLTLTSDIECRNSDIVTAQFKLARTETLMKIQENPVAPKNKMTTKDQFYSIVNFMEENPTMAQNGRYNKTEYTQLWTNLSEQLNEIGPPIRTIDEWRKIWTGMKASIKKRLEEKKINIDDNTEDILEDQLSPMERRMFKIMQMNNESNATELMDTSPIEFEVFEVNSELDPLTPENDCHNKFMDNTQFELIDYIPDRTSTWTTRDQYNLLLNFMEDNPICIKKFIRHSKSNPASLDPQNLWTILADQLNAIGPPTKSLDKWKKVWADFKIKTNSRIRKKILCLKMYKKNYTENDINKKLTKLEQRMYKILKLSGRNFTDSIEFENELDSIEFENGLDSNECENEPDMDTDQISMPESQPESFEIKTELDTTNTDAEGMNLQENHASPPKNPTTESLYKFGDEMVSDSLVTFGKFVVDELHYIQSAGGDILLRQTKMKIQQTILESLSSLNR